MNEYPGEAIQWDVPDQDIGGELLSILSKGLYPSPLDCIREYVQNAVDAQAKKVTIRITGNSVVIHDNGEGMNLPEIVESRKFGVSPKSVSTHVGFRGIGIYSGFDICNRLVLTTKKSSESRAYVLEFEFGLMKHLLDTERQIPNSQRTPLTKLLSDYSRFRMEADDSDDQYTIVQLEELSNTHIDQLADREKLRKYMLQNLPIDFDETFPHKERISQALRDHVPGYNAITIDLETDTAARETIARPAIPNLDDPKMGWIYNSSGSNKRPVAYYWCALHLGGKKIPDQYADYSGFVYKVKGFTIGDNRRLEKLFKRGNAALYWWHTGEIYVTDPSIIPNAARDDFEPGQPKIQLDAAVRDELKKIESSASTYQQRNRADRVVTQASEDITQIQLRVSGPHYDALDEYTKIGNIIEVLKEQRSKVSDKDALAELVQYAEKLRKIVRRVIDQPQEAAARPASDVPPVPTTPANTSQPASQKDATKPKAEPQPKKVLSQVFEYGGWNLSSDTLRVIEVIESSMLDIIGGNSELYNRLLEDIEAKILTGE
jgi:hypothetical protein